MSEIAAAVAAENRPEVIVGSWSIEADHPRNSELLIQSIPNLRLRSAFDGLKPAVTKNGKSRTPIDQALQYAGYPRTRGKILTVNPVRLLYEVTDPLHGDVATCAQIRDWLQEKGLLRRPDIKLDGDPPVRGELDVHSMKTLCREMLNLVKQGEAKTVRGDEPTLADINRLPGRYLLNPGLRTSTSQPRYEDDLQGWVDRMNSGGLG